MHNKLAKESGQLWVGLCPCEERELCCSHTNWQCCSAWWLCGHDATADPLVWGPHRLQKMGKNPSKWKASGASLLEHYEELKFLIMFKKACPKCHLSRNHQYTKEESEVSPIGSISWWRDGDGEQGESWAFSKGRRLNESWCSGSPEEHRGEATSNFQPFTNALCLSSVSCLEAGTVPLRILQIWGICRMFSGNGSHTLTYLFQTPLGEIILNPCSEPKVEINECLSVDVSRAQIHKCKQTWVTV